MELMSYDGGSYNLKKGYPGKGTFELVLIAELLKANRYALWVGFGCLFNGGQVIVRQDTEICLGLVSFQPKAKNHVDRIRACRACGTVAARPHPPFW